MKTILTLALTILTSTGWYIAAREASVKPAEGTVALQAGTVPAGIRCIRVVAMGSRTTTRTFDVMTGQTAVFELNGLPIGQVAFTVETFDTPCPMVTGASTPIWTSDSTTVTVDQSQVAQVGFSLRRNARASISLTFEGDATPPPSSTTLFPATSPFYQDISTAPLDPESAQIMMFLSGAGWPGGRLRLDTSMVVLPAASTVMPRGFMPTNNFSMPDCDLVSVPLPPMGRLEGESNYSCQNGGDCRLIVVQGTRLFEMFGANVTGGAATGGTFTGACLAVWDTTRDYWMAPSPFGRGDQCVSADAGGLPITPLLLNPDEIKSGTLTHALRFNLPNNYTRRAYVHPATHAGSGTAANGIPVGARLRLKANFAVATLPPSGQVIARALQQYGMILADAGNIVLTGVNDTQTTTKWAELDVQNALSSLRLTDFEMVTGGQRFPSTGNCQRAP